MDFLSEVKGWKLLSAFPWILHAIFTLITLVVFVSECVSFHDLIDYLRVTQLPS